MTIRNEVAELLEEMGITYEDAGCSCERRSIIPIMRCRQRNG